MLDRFRFSVDPDGCESGRIIRPQLSALVIIFQRKEFHSVNLRDQLLELFPGNGALFRRSLTFHKPASLKNNRAVSSDRQFIVWATSKTLSPFKGDHQILGNSLRGRRLG